MFTDQNGKTWYKGNLHTHTTNSDGRKTPEEAIALYQSHGYDFLALTEHWKFTPGGMTDNGLLLLSGDEYNVGGSDILAGVFHIVGIGMTEEPALDRNASGLSAQDIIDAIHEKDGLAVLAHPAWSMETAEQILPLQNIDMTEIYNSVSQLPHNCRPYSGEVIDQLAARGKFLPCSAADDSHFYDGEECLSYIWVQADALTREALLDAIRAGRFFATQGPRVRCTVTPEENGNKTITVSCAQPEGCAPVRTVVFYTGSVWHGMRSVNGDNVTEAVFRARPQDRFVRPEIIDADGRHAWLTPIPV